MSGKKSDFIIVLKYTKHINLDKRDLLINQCGKVMIFFHITKNYCLTLKKYLNKSLSSNFDQLSNYRKFFFIGKILTDKLCSKKLCLNFYSYQTVVTFKINKL